MGECTEVWVRVVVRCGERCSEVWGSVVRCGGGFVRSEVWRERCSDIWVGGSAL